MILQFFAWQIKHFIADYPLQTQVMLGKFKPYPEFIWPLFLHSFVHAASTLILCGIFGWPLWFVGADLATHFAIDRLKANKNWLGRWSPNEKYFWWALGLDQMLHQFVGIFFIYWSCK